MKIRQMILCIITSVMVLGLTGCNPDKIWDGVNSAVLNRQADNTKEIERLYEAGVITTEQKDILIKSIEKSADAIIKQIEEEDLDIIKSYITWAAGDSDDLPYNEKSGGEYKYPILNQYYKVKDNIVGLAQPSLTEGLPIVGEQARETLEDIMRMKIMVLKSPTGKTYDNESLQELSNAVYLIKTEGEGGAQYKQAVAVLNSYYTDSGQVLTNTPILKVTDTVSSSKTSTKVGEDLVLTSNGYGTTHIKLLELNPKALKEIIGSNEDIKDKYVRVGTNLYLMEYPINTVSSASVVDSDGTKTYKLNVEKGYTTENGDMIEERRMRLNILTGKMLTADGTVMESNNTEIYTVNGKDGGECSFVIDGTTKYRDIGADKVVVDGCLRIVLVEYLEIVPLKGLTSGEDFVAFGRRIKFSRLSGGVDDAVGYYTDKLGRRIEDSVDIYAQDLVGTESFKGDQENKLVKLALNSAVSTDVDSDEDDTNTDYSGSDWTTNTAKIKYDSWYKNKISLRFWLPGKYVDSADIGTVGGANTKLIMCGVATDKNIFDTALYSNWIEAKENTDIGSLTWWNQWLSDNGFNYSIDKNKLNDLLVEKYNYELNDSGVIVLDINTINKIQSDYDYDDKVSDVTKVRTQSVVMGMLLIGYALALVAAWYIDTTTVVGPKILNKLSFNRWVAVTREDEAPMVDEKNRSYFKLGDVVQRALFIIALGVLLQKIDVIEIMNAILKAFTGFAEGIKNVMFR